MRLLDLFCNQQLPDWNITNRLRLCSDDARAQNLYQTAAFCVSSGLLPDWSILQGREDHDRCEETIDSDYIQNLRSMVNFNLGEDVVWNTYIV
ncbi:hypothetical protein BY996DRAFT_6536425 [Phakopsora pachyrhizi]|nr:hypothetical protein BY996DRAFT_6536425 [Phakopsora pachyrhizi]